MAENEILTAFDDFLRNVERLTAGIPQDKKLLYVMLVFFGLLSVPASSLPGFLAPVFGGIFDVGSNMTLESIEVVLGALLFFHVASQGG